MRGKRCGAAHPAVANSGALGDDRGVGRRAAACRHGLTQPPRGSPPDAAAVGVASHPPTRPPRTAAYVPRPPRRRRAAVGERKSTRRRGTAGRRGGGGRGKLVWYPCATGATAGPTSVRSATSVLCVPRHGVGWRGVEGGGGSVWARPPQPATAPRRPSLLAKWVGGARAAAPAHHPTQLFQRVRRDLRVPPPPWQTSALAPQQQSLAAPGIQLRWPACHRANLGRGRFERRGKPYSGQPSGRRHQEAPHLPGEAATSRLCQYRNNRWHEHPGIRPTVARADSADSSVLNRVSDGQGPPNGSARAAGFSFAR